MGCDGTIPPWLPRAALAVIPISTSSRMMQRDSGPVNRNAGVLPSAFRLMERMLDDNNSYDWLS